MLRARTVSLLAVGLFSAPTLAQGTIPTSGLVGAGDVRVAPSGLPTTPWTPSARITSLAQTGGGPGLGTISGSARFQVTPHWFVPGGPPAWYEVTFPDPGTGFGETYIVQVPPEPPSIAKPAPLVVFFHAFGKSGNDVWQSTTFLDEVITRNWFLISPLGASKKHFNSLPAQQNIEACLEMLFELYGERIDRSRIYGIGFSMGGGAACGFAARHVDLDEYSFAAIVNHTGGVSQKDTYIKDLGVQSILELWFGGPPSLFPFEYERSSAISYDQFTFAIDTATDFARNLTHVPIYNHYATGDPLSYLRVQTILFHGHMQALGGTSELHTVQANIHHWSTLNETTACDWLSQHSLSVPTSASTIADADGTWFHFDVTQDASGAWTPFSWSVDVPGNAFTLSQTENLSSLEVDTASAGLDTTQTLTVTLSTADGVEDAVILTGYEIAPSTILRDDVVTSAFDWIAPAGELALLEPDGTTQHVWTIQP